VHGRALPIAQGIKMANPDLLVLVAGGDGDGFSIGGGHVPHAIRRNLDLTYIVMDNHIYGLTKGQLSPTTPRGSKTPTSTYGSIEEPVNPLLYVLAYGAGFVAQGVPADMDGLAKMIEEAIRYPGFSFVNIQSPCVTFGDAEDQMKVQKTRMRKLAAEGHDPSNRLRAMELAQATAPSSTPASSTGTRTRRRPTTSIRDPRTAPGRRVRPLLSPTLPRAPANAVRPAAGLFDQGQGGGECDAAGRRFLEEPAFERTALPGSFGVQPAGAIPAQGRTGLGKAGDGRLAAGKGDRQPERLQLAGIITRLELDKIEEGAVAAQAARPAELFT
jgi:hypothetical protein